MIPHVCLKRAAYCCPYLLAAVLAVCTSASAQSANDGAASTERKTEEKSDAVVLTPFEVNTNKDHGYAAGNTLSGGRMDTPLKITPASISVMTREFLDDFAITDMNGAAAWTLNMDPPTGGENGPFGGNRFQANFRGAGNGSNYPSRNGALQYFVADSYNSERFEFSRGPNAALFGDAGPGGMQGSSSKQARFNDRNTSISARADTFGGYRATLDTSYGVEKFALRLNALQQDTAGYQDGTSNKQHAFSLATTVALGKNTRLRGTYERSSEKQVQYRTTYGENASLWNRTTVNENNTAIDNPNSFGLEQISPTNDYLVWNFATNSLINYKGQQYRTRGLGYQIPWGGRSDLPNFKPGVPKHFNLGPADAVFDRDANIREVYLEHRFTPDLFLQLAWLSSDIDPVALYSQGLPGDYRIDVNKLLPNGSPNPQFGKAYSDFSQNSQFQQNEVDEYRFIANYNFEVQKWFGMKQSFMLNGGWRQDLYQAWTRGWRWTNNPAQPNPTNGVNALNFRVYWDQPRPNMVPVLPPNVPGMTFRNMDIGFAADNDRRLTYGQFLSQTSFFDERLGLMLSARRDKVEDDVTGNIGFDPVTYELLWGAQNPATLKNEVGRHNQLTTYRTSKNAGIVVYPFPQRYKWLAPFGFVVNYSQNFSIPGTGPNLITGERPAPPVATTTDWGLRYSMPNGIAYATLTRYHTEQTGNIINFGNQGNNTAAGTGAPGFRDIWRNLGYTETHLTGDDFNYRDTNDRRLEGWEFEVTANPSRNITLTANYAHPLVYNVSDSPGRRSYYAAHLTEFAAGANAQPGQVVNGHTVIDPGIIKTAMQNIENSFNGFAPGTLSNGLERHRINVAGSYRFTEGRLKGFAVNAGVNYRAHRKIGSRDAQIKFGTTTPTIAQTVAAGYDYIWADPYYTVAAGANYTRRFGRYTMRFQLNVTNLLNNDDPLWGNQVTFPPPVSVINANQLLNGNPRMQVVSGFTQLEPRKFTFTTTLNF